MLVFGALPISWVVARVMTSVLTGWNQPDPDAIIQGCETSIECDQSATFWPVLVAVLVLNIALVVLVALHVSRRATRRRAAQMAASAGSA
jgi:hypothetical protein